jgi:hypothetical protein
MKTEHDTMAPMPDHPPRSPRRKTIVDARGQPTDVLDPFLMHLLGKDGGIPEETLRAIAEEIGPGVKVRDWHVFWILTIAPILVAVGGGVLIAAFGRFTDNVGMILWLTIVALVTISVLGFMHSTRRKRARRVVAVMLRHHHCPHCGYDLSNLPRDPADSATICPECGHAWHLPSQTA